MELKYILHLFFMAAATGCSMAAVGLTFDSFDIKYQEEACGKGKVRAMGGFAVMSCIIAALGFILGIVSLFKPLKIVNIIFAVVTFAFSVIPWAIAADLWDHVGTVTVSGSQFTVTNCGLKNFPTKFLALFVACTGSAIFALVVLFLMADAASADSAEKPAAEENNNKPADAGNVDDKKQQEETPQPSNNDEEEAKKKQQQQEEEAAAAKKKQQEEEAAAAEQQKKQQQEQEAAAAAQKQQQEQEAAAAAAQKQKEQEEAAAAQAAADAAAAQKQKEEEEAAAAAAAAKKAEEEKAAAEAAAAAQKSNKPQINWKEINAKLPYDKKNAEQKKRRFEMFDQIDTNGTGKVSLSEVTAGMESVLGLGDEIDVPIVIKTAFDKAKVAGQQAGVNEDASGGDFIEKNEFRLFLMYTRMYFEMYQLFSELDESGDMRIELDEFEKAIPLLKTWGAKIEDPATTFKQIDANGGGKILFAEFVDWALSPEQNLDCPDEDE